ncbi:hypothetical protein FRAHR75_1550006 [Frankia sp. Hr75.2]|nr:hypothetical protein FRAHR75_1550006 [Frankia sp. Hr75.2]
MLFTVRPGPVPGVCHPCAPAVRPAPRAGPGRVGRLGAPAVGGPRFGGGGLGSVLVLGYSPFGFFLAVSGGIPGEIRSERASEMRNGEQATPMCGVFVR